MHTPMLTRQIAVVDRIIHSVEQRPHCSKHFEAHDFQVTIEIFRNHVM